MCEKYVLLKVLYPLRKSIAYLIQLIRRDLKPHAQIDELDETEEMSIRQGKTPPANLRKFAQIYPFA